MPGKDRTVVKKVGGLCAFLTNKQLQALAH